MSAPMRSASCLTGSSEASVCIVVRVLQTMPSTRPGPSRKATVIRKAFIRSPLQFIAQLLLLTYLRLPQPAAYLLAYSASLNLRRFSKFPVDPHNGRWRAAKDPAHQGSAGRSVLGESRLKSHTKTASALGSKDLARRSAVRGLRTLTKPSAAGLAVRTEALTSLCQ